MMSVHENDERPTYALLSLFKLSCLALTPDQDSSLSKSFKKRLNMDVQVCCRSLLEVINNNKFNPLGDRRHMYNKVQRGGVLNVRITDSAVKFGHIDCLKIAHEIGFPLHLTDEEINSIPGVSLEYEMIIHHADWSPMISHSAICSNAAFYGTLPCLQYAHQLGFPWDATSCAAAAEGGNMDCLEYLVENGCPLDGPEPTKAAASVGNLIILQYLHEHGCPWSVNTCSSAAAGGYLDCLEYLQANGCPWDMSTTINAIYSNSLTCLKFAIEKGCPFNDSIIDRAAIIGNLPILKYLHGQGCLWSVETSSNAAMEGHLECLTYVRANGCPWDSSTCKKAVLNMYAICRLFQRLHGLSWNEKTCMDAMNGHTQAVGCINYAWRNGCPWRNGTCLAGSGDGRMDCLLSEPDHVCKWNLGKFQNYTIQLRSVGSITPAQVAFLLFKCMC